MRDFEKISFEQFKNDIKDDKNLYEEYLLPMRNSSKTAGYDFYLIEDVTIKVGEIKKIPTGIKSYYEDDEMLFLIIRSGMGFKYNLRLCNQIGVIDSDYYNNSENEGHMWFKIQNEGTEDVTFKKGEAIIQGIFLKYLTTKSDLNKNQKRIGKY